MDSEQKRTVVAAVLFVSFLLGLLELHKVLDPCTMQTATFRGGERRIAVCTERQAVSVGGLSGGSEIFEQNGNMMARVIFAVPRRGIHITMRTASVDEVELFRKFF